MYTKLHKNPNSSIFSNFHDPAYAKLHKNQMLQFSLIFMTPGTRNLTKIKCFNFLQLSWPRVHETSQKSNASIFSNFYDPGYTKPHKNQILQFSLIFMTPGRQNFTKIKCFNFLQFSWTRVDEISQNSNASIFSDFYDPGYVKLHKNQIIHETSQKSDPSFSSFRAAALEFNQFQLLLLLAFWVQPTSRQPLPL